MCDLSCSLELILYLRAAFLVILSEINLTPHNLNLRNPREVPFSYTLCSLISSYIGSNTDITQETAYRYAPSS